jgi:pimeloyl-ACP methyl ester carboxylesterase
MALRRINSAALILAAVFVCGCATAPGNPTFDVSAHDARKALGEMRDSRRKLERPVIVLDGLGPPAASWILSHEVRRLTGDRRVIGVTFVFTGSFEDCRRRLIDAVERHFPSDDPHATREVDVIAVSMGGVVARYAASPPPSVVGKRLSMARLFTISSPHRGAAMASLPPVLGRLQLDMREDSRFLRALDRRDGGATYELYPYVRLGDRIVGETNAAPAGVRPLWLPNLLLEGAHVMCWTDPRIIADIARRLRGETPFATLPGSPLPRRRA